ncbi:hypothetical protein QBC33DRAFT_462864, partial [Phialemonium atrogriseum]
RHIAIAILNWYLNKAFGKDIGKDSKFDKDDKGMLDSIWDLQARHSMHVAGMIYMQKLQQEVFRIVAW